MPVIPIPFILSGNGPVDSLFGTVGFWVLLLLVIVIISAAYALLKGEISLPRMNVTGRNIIAAFLIAVAGGVAFIVYPLLLLPLLVAVLVVLAFLEVKSMDKDLDSGAWNRYPGPATYDTGFVNAGFRVGDEPVQNVKPVRPEKPGPASDTGEQKRPSNDVRPTRIPGNRITRRHSGPGSRTDWNIFTRSVPTGLPNTPWRHKSSSGSLGRMSSAMSAAGGTGDCRSIATGRIVPGALPKNGDPGHDRVVAR